MGARATAMWDRVRHGIPSSDPRRYWRGPIWPKVNTLIALGFAGMGREREAARRRRETAALIAAGRFHGHFDPTDGTACGGSEVTWTAAIRLGCALALAGRA